MFYYYMWGIVWKTLQVLEWKDGKYTQADILKRSWSSINIIQDIKWISKNRNGHHILIIGLILQENITEHLPTTHYVQDQAPHSSFHPDGVFSYKIPHFPEAHSTPFFKGAL